MKRLERNLRKEKNRFLNNVRSAIVKDFIDNNENVLNEIARRQDNDIDKNITSSKIDQELETIHNKSDISKEPTQCEETIENNVIIDKSQKSKDNTQDKIKNGDDFILDEEKWSATQTSEPEIPGLQVEIVEGILKTLSLSKNSNTYGVENFSKNAMVIFNHYKIEGYKPRYGTQRDVAALIDTFGKLDFKIHVHDDLTRYEISSTLNEFSSKDFSQYGCIAVAVLTHGLEGGYLIAGDSRSYHESEIIEHFFNNNPTLVTKPKVFIFQACRGTSTSPGVSSPPTERQQLQYIESDSGDAPHSYYLPTQADVLLLHSTYAGNSAYRDRNEGSWFIQSLCKHVDCLAVAVDLESIMTEVKKDVATNKSYEFHDNSTGRTEISKQMPVVMSTLIRKLYLKTRNSN